MRLIEAMKTTTEENKKQVKRTISNSPMKAIRAKCLDCSGGSSNEVKMCPIKDCPLYPFRFGKRVGIRGKNMSDDQKKEIGKRLQKGRLEMKENG